MVERDNIVLPLIRAIRAELADMHTQVAAKNDLTELRSELRSDIADVAADLIATRKVLSEQIFGLRRAVIDYHSTVIRHGMMIGDLTNVGAPARAGARPGLTLHRFGDRIAAAFRNRAGSTGVPSIRVS